MSTILVRAVLSMDTYTKMLYDCSGHHAADPCISNVYEDFAMRTAKTRAPAKTRRSTAASFWACS